MTTNTPNLYCLTITRSPGGRWQYWCVARYEAGLTKDGRLTWRRAEDLTDGYRSQDKAIRESGISEFRILRDVRQNQEVRL
jgi:hypothetical protein